MNLFSFILEFIEKLFEFLFETVGMLFSGSKRNTTYNADFISERDVLSSWNKGFCLTGKRNLTIKDSFQNALIIGGTGVGKSSIVLIPSILKMKSSLLIHDPAGELYSNTSGAKYESHLVQVLNFAKPELSCGYNPLSRANTSSEIQKVASMLIENSLGKGSKDPFWNTQAVSLLSMLISIVKKQESEYQNLFNVRQLLNKMGGNPKEVDALFSRYADEILFSEYKSFIAFDEKVVSGVLATCKAALQIFADDAVARVTSTDTINFETFRKKPVALFIQNSIFDQKYYSVLTSIFFEQFLGFLLSKIPGNDEQDVYLLIDEAASLFLPTLPLAVANVRKHRSGIMLLVQDFSQIIHHYGRYDAEAIKSNCFSKLYFSGQSLETTKELESILGKYEFEDEKGHKVVRALMTSDEIRIMPKNKALLICGNLPPIVTKLRPFYKRRFLRQLSHIPPVVIQGEVLNDVPVLPLTIPEDVS